MAFNKFVEEKIRNAIAEGEFDNLSGWGKPIDLTSYFNTPSEFRVGYSLLKSNKFVPEEVEVLSEIGALRRELRNSKNKVAKGKLTRTLNEKELALAILTERRKRRR